MSFDFTKEEYELLKEQLMLDDELAKILEMKIKNYSITKMSIELNMSISSINRRISRLKKEDKEIIMTFLRNEVEIFCFFFYAIMKLERRNTT